MKIAGVLMVTLAATFLICFIIAKVMVHKRILLAKDFILKRDSMEKVEDLMKIAEDEFSNETFKENENCIISKTIKNCTIIKKVKNGKIFEVDVSTEGTYIIASENGNKMDIHNLAISEESAILMVISDLFLWVWLFVAIFTFNEDVIRFIRS